MKGIESKNCVIVVKRKVTKVLNPKRLIVEANRNMKISRNPSNVDAECYKNHYAAKTAISDQPGRCCSY